MLAPDAWVPLGVVSRAHGVKGELRVQTFNRDSELLLHLPEVLIRAKNGDERACAVDQARPTNGAVLMKFRHVDGRDQADALKGAVICARRREFPLPEDGEFYVCDVTGARVVVEGTDAPPMEFGRVSEIKSYPSISVMVVQSADDGLWEVPLVDSIVRSVDVLRNVVTLATLQGVERG
jgi:16S rRNA processing protein RimM